MNRPGNSRHRRSLPVAVALLLVGVTIGPSSVTQASSTSIDYLNAFHAASQDSEATVDELSALQATLRAQKKDHFGGLWIDDAGNPHVAIAHGDNGIRSASAAALTKSPTFRSVVYSEAELVAIQDAIADEARADGTFVLSGAEVSSIEQDLQNNRVIIYLVSPTAGQNRAVKAKWGDAVVVETVDEAVQPACSESDCPSPMKAGLRMYNVAGSYDGMSAFVFRYTDGSGYLMATAGHVSTLNETKYHPNYTYRGKVLYDVDNGYAIDASLYSISPSQAGNKIYDTNGSFAIGSITSREKESNTVVSEKVCMSAKSGTRCSTLINTNTDLAWAADQYKTNTYAYGGDSGSPMFYGSKAQGILVANSCDGCAAAYYTPIQRVETFWGNDFMVLTYAP